MPRSVHDCVVACIIDRDERVSVERARGTRVRRPQGYRRRRTVKKLVEYDAPVQCARSA